MEGDLQNGNKGQSGLLHGLMMSPSPPVTCSSFKAPGEGDPASTQDCSSHTFVRGQGRTRSFTERGHHGTLKPQAARGSLKWKPGAIKHDCLGPK